MKLQQKSVRCRVKLKLKSDLLVYPVLVDGPHGGHVGGQQLGQGHLGGGLVRALQTLQLNQGNITFDIRF